MNRITFCAAVIVVVVSMMSTSMSQIGSSEQSSTSSQQTLQQQVASLAENRTVHDAFDWFNAQRRALSDMQLEVTAIPAPPFGEIRRAEWVKQKFQEFGLEQVQIDGEGNVLGVRPGTDSGAKYVLLSAHLDTVFPSGTKLKVGRDGEKLRGPGISDNGAGITALLAIAGSMQQTGLKTNAPILFVGNVGEEGEGDLRGMRHVFSDQKWKDAIEYTVVLDGGGSDSIVAQGLGSRRFLVTINGPGGHSWSDFGTPNPIAVLAKVIDRFNRTSVPANPKTTFNIGSISGGTSVNAIPESASMKVDVRSSSPVEIERVERSLRNSLNQAMSEYSSTDGKALLTCSVKLIGDRPAAELLDNARILQAVRAVDTQLHIATRMQRASTDANIPLSMGREALTLGAGGTGGGAHTLHEWYDPTGRELGLKRILLSILMLTGLSQ